MIGQRATKEEYIQVLDTLLAISPRQRRYLRNFPPTPGGKIPCPPRDADVAMLVEAGIIASKGATHDLTRLGKLAREEIRAAECYIAEHLAVLSVGV